MSTNSKRTCVLRVCYDTVKLLFFNVYLPHEDGEGTYDEYTLQLETILWNNIKTARSFTCIKNVESAIMLQHCLDLICNWATSWQLKLFHSKCTMLSLGKAHVNTLYRCCDVVLPIVNQMTDLDILIDAKLSFSSQY